MTPSKILTGLQQASAWTEARGGRELPSEADREFLECLHTEHVNAWIGHDRKDPSSRAWLRSEHLGWAEYVTGLWPEKTGWRLTPAGRVVLETRVHTAGNGEADHE